MLVVPPHNSQKQSQIPSGRTYFKSGLKELQWKWVAHNQKSKKKKTYQIILSGSKHKQQRAESNICKSQIL